MKKSLALFLTIVLLCFCLFGCGTLKIPAPENSVPTLDKDLVILYTNDVHCGIDDAIGYAGLADYKKAMESAGNYVVLADCGDAIQGTPIGMVSKGEYLIDIMNEAGYDIAVPGNHEFDYGVSQYLELAKKAKFTYLSANFTEVVSGTRVIDAYKIMEFNGVKVAFIGISTPLTMASAGPSYFKNEQGDYLYDFCRDEDGTCFYTVVQETVDNVRAAGAEYVIALGHLGIEDETKPFQSSDVITNTSGIDVFLDGHSHTTMPCERIKNKEGKEVLLSQTGTKLENIGMLRITKEGNIQTELITGYSGKNADMESFIEDIRATFEEGMTNVVAATPYDLTIHQPGTDPAVRIVRSAETNLGDLCADAVREISGTDIGIMNGGGIRVSVPAGEITYEDVLTVFPFANSIHALEITGDKLLDMLELSVKFVPTENGEFLQVSGLIFEIHTYLPSGVRLDSDGNFTGVDGEYRVKNVIVGGEPLDPSKTYTIAGPNFILLNGGGGYTMFNGCREVKSLMILDNQVLLSFLKDTLGGIVSDAYESPFGQERIVAVESKPTE